MAEINGTCMHAHGKSFQTADFNGKVDKYIG
jgi:hypothetical protein